MREKKIDIDFDFKTMGQRIKKRRKHAHLTQAAFSEMVGLSTVHMSNIENGKEHPSFHVFIKICQILNVNPDYFIIGNIRSNNVSEEITKNLSLCADEDVETIAYLTEYFVNKSMKKKQNNY